MLKAEVRDGVLEEFSGSGNVIINAADIGVIISAMYHAFCLENEQCAAAFRQLIQDGVADDSPVWDKSWRMAAFAGYAVVTAPSEAKGD